MNVVWVNRFGPQLASYRYRAEVPCTEVAKHNGFKTSINNGEADIVIYSKPFKEDLEAAKQAKADGAKVIADLGDDHFARDPMYKEFAELADAIVCPTTTMRARIYDYVKKDAVVIPDPYEMEECAPHADGEFFLWFGHVGNFHELQMVMPFLGTRKLRVVSGPQQIPNTIQWSLPNLKAAFEQSNIVLLPTKSGAEHKSPNRLLNSIRAGCFPVCMLHPSYAEFRKMVWVGDFITGLKWVDSFKCDLDGLVSHAQDYIRDRYSPETVGKQWASFLGSL